ncbi:MAG: BON domain-containing protein [Rhodocyclaceae bacterium]|nr:BON domain-containing protein [Rhodocyclaceae bacterium]MDZ4215457.1 BON domain-containing protein [Rhodocyclaceae bacterium]
MNVRTLTLLALLVPILSGCIGAAAVGVGAGALIYADRRATETVFTDEGIEIRATNRIREKFGDRVHVNVTSYNRTVLLTGEVPDAAARDEIEKMVSGVVNVKAISNELAVAGHSSLSSRSNDVFITSKVKARFIDAAQVSPVHVKVVTENGVVYLMGLVTQGESTAAVEIARTTGGVMKVVRVFEIISDAEARRLDPQKTAPQPAAPVK